MGRASLRYAGWVEFGGTRRAPVTSTRDYLPQGRYLFPRAVSLAGVVAKDYEHAVSEVLAGFDWTNQTADPGGIHD
jgi:hypothetical protein